MIFEPLFIAVSMTLLATAVALKIKRINKAHAEQLRIKTATERAVLAQARRLIQNAK